MTIHAIVQIRSNSIRLPNKALMKIKNQTIIEILLKRLSNSRKIDEIIISTTNNNSDDFLAKKIKELGYKVFRGSEKDVLDRIYKTAKLFKTNTIVRITGDCPLIDPNILDNMIQLYLSTDSDYVSDTTPPTFPDGLDVEVFSFKSLQIAHNESTKAYDREHVTPYIINNDFFKKKYYKNVDDLSKYRLTLDTHSDFLLIENIVNSFYPDINMSWKKIIDYLDKNPEIIMLNSSEIRNEGANMSSGQKLYQRAKKVIPGGTMLLSKRPEMFLPEKWPSYFTKAKGCKVWDMDNKEYFDMSIMGVGTNILGYGYDEIDEVVKETISKGNMSTLNCPEEVYLAEKLIKMHPWANMVRFARSGGEANAIAIRIARAATKKDKVAICGYHGWHDWYLSTNISSTSNLNDHLLPGLSSLGVPKNLEGTTIPFKYNDLEGFKKIVSENQDLGIVKMEVSRNLGPEDNFLKEIREITSSKGIVLIFDECSSGFRETFGGLHLKFDIQPDLAMFGKALGNGYAITAVIGKQEIMRSAQETFISSTFWTERIGPTAALKTLEVMEKLKSWEIITNIGKKIEQKWIKIAEKNNLKIITGGLPAFINYKLDYRDWPKYKTYITQEMLKNNFLASNAVYTCIDHSDDIIENYIHNLDKIFKRINEFIEKKENIEKFLEGPISHNTFKRLN